MSLTEHIAQEPWILRGWVYWLMAINTASVLFVIWRVEARFILLAWVINLFFMPFLFDQFGYTRILGLSHIVVWTPLLIYLWPRLRHHPAASFYGGYLWLLFVSDLISLGFDYVDLLRYLAGDGQL